MGIAGIGHEIARGSRSVVHAWGDDSTLVVKVPLAATPDRWIAFEARYADSIAALGAPLPRQHGTRDVDGRLVSLSQRIDGPSLWQHVLANPDEARAGGALLADIETSLFAIAPSAVLPRQRDRLASKIRRAAADYGVDLLRALGPLDCLDRPELETGLCHGDLHPSNVLLAEDGPIIIDWFDACRGVALPEVARTSLMLVPVDPRRAPAHLDSGDVETLRVVNEAYIERITAAIPAIDLRSLGRWRAVQSVARLAEGLDVDSLPAIRTALDDALA